MLLVRISYTQNWPLGSNNKRWREDHHRVPKPLLPIYANPLGKCKLCGRIVQENIVLSSQNVSAGVGSYTVLVLLWTTPYAHVYFTEDDGYTPAVYMAHIIIPCPKLNVKREEWL